MSAERSAHERGHQWADSLVVVVEFVGGALAIMTGPALGSRLILTVGLASVLYGAYRLLRQWHKEMGRATVVSILVLCAGSALLGGGVALVSAPGVPAAHASNGGGGNGGGGNGGSGQPTVATPPSSAPPSVVPAGTPSTSSSGSPTPVPTNLVDLTPGLANGIEVGDWNMYGVPYHQALGTPITCNSPASRIYTLAGRFKTFHALVGFSDDTDGSIHGTFLITGDGGKVLFQKENAGVGAPTPVGISVAGDSQLELRFSYGCGFGGAGVWAQAQLS